MELKNRGCLSYLPAFDQVLYSCANTYQVKRQSQSVAYQTLSDKRDVLWTIFACASLLRSFGDTFQQLLTNCLSEA